MSRPLKLLIVGNYAPDRQESMLRFSNLLHHEMKAHGHQVEYISPQPLLNRSGAGPTGISKWLGYVDKFLLFPFLLKRAARHADLVHITDHSNALYVKTVKRKPHLINCHDVLAIRAALGEIDGKSTGWTGKILQKLVLRGLNQADRIACISKNTHQELLRISQVEPQNATVIYMGLNYPYAPMETAKAWEKIGELVGQRKDELARNSYVFHVGGNQWYKNRIGVLKIYNQLRNLYPDDAMPRLVMAGQQLSENMREFISENKLQNLVFEVQKCSNEELRAFYSTAGVMLFPSLAEGFGWPVVEAQACGSRVVTSNFSPLTEIGGEAAIYCDPQQENEVAKQIKILLDESEENRRKRSEDGIRNAERFATQSMIKQYIEIYQEIAER